MLALRHEAMELCGLARRTAGSWPRIPWASPSPHREADTTERACDIVAADRATCRPSGRGVVIAGVRNRRVLRCTARAHGGVVEVHHLAEALGSEKDALPLVGANHAPVRLFIPVAARWGEIAQLTALLVPQEA